MVHRWAPEDTTKIPWFKSPLGELGLDAGEVILHRDSSGRLTLAERADIYNMPFALGASTSGWSTSAATISAESTEVFHGQGSVKLVSTASGNGTYYGQYTFSGWVGINYGTYLHTGVWLKASSTNVARAYIHFEDWAGRWSRFDFTIPYANEWFLAKVAPYKFSGNGESKVKATPDESSGTISFSNLKKIRLGFVEPATAVKPTIYIDFVHQMDDFAWWKMDYGSNGISSIERRGYHTGNSVLTTNFNYDSTGVLKHTVSTVA